MPNIPIRMAVTGNARGIEDRIASAVSPVPGAPETDCVLSNGLVVLGIARHGGAITHCTVGGLPLFFPASEATEPFPFANFMLAPFSNRIAGGAFYFGGKRHAVAPNLVDPRFPLPIHGFGWQGDWQIDQQADDHAVLTLAQTNPEWPAPFSLVQTLRLTSQGYDHAIAVRNEGEEPMPAGLGLHPYFPAGALGMETGCSAIWLTGDDGIPHDHSPLAAEPDWFSGGGYDCGFDWPGGRVKISWPDRILDIDADPLFGQLVVYVPQGQPFFCVEPVSHPTNAINRSGGMTVLAPGESLAGTVRFFLTVAGQSAARA